MKIKRTMIETWTRRDEVIYRLEPSETPNSETDRQESKVNVATPLSALPDFMMLGAQEGISLPNVS